MIVQVLLPALNLFPLDYSIPEGWNINVGDIIKVPFRKKEISGIVWKTEVQSDKKLRTAISTTEYKISVNTLQLINKTSAYYIASLGSVAKLVLPFEISKCNTVFKQEIPPYFNLAVLSEEQQLAYENLKNSKISLLKGVTGSGKTEVYFYLIERYLRLNKQVLIMIPEVVLAQQMISRFEKQFNFTPAVWHHLTKISDKKNFLNGIINGNARVVIGTRSSLFLPYKNLGLIVVDEEHDGSYKQDEGVVYNARDMAVLRGHIENIPVVLSSATPSIESYYNCCIGKYKLVNLESRYFDVKLPSINIIDMTKQRFKKNSWISPTLIIAIKEKLALNQQVLLFLNRKGYAPLVLCHVCNFRYTCGDCATWLVWHQNICKLICHRCGYSTALKEHCPDCNAVDSYVMCGPGIERIAEEVEKYFPNHKYLLLSRDILKKSSDFDLAINQILKEEVDIIIGTQIITKGHHFPKITLVGVLDSDVGSLGGDLRAFEKTFQLLQQVGGRAGREKISGAVYLQTYFPNNIIIRTIAQNDEKKFLETELENRRTYNLPPFSRIVSILVSGKDMNTTDFVTKNLAKIAPLEQNITILGPTPAMLHKLRGKYRFYLLVISTKTFNVQNYINNWINNYKTTSSINIKIDVDPYNFY